MNNDVTIQDFALAAKSVRMCRGCEESGLFAEGKTGIDRNP